MSLRVQRSEWFIGDLEPLCRLVRSRGRVGHRRTIFESRGGDLGPAGGNADAGPRNCVRCAGIARTALHQGRTTLPKAPSLLSIQSSGALRGTRRSWRARFAEAIATVARLRSGLGASGALPENVNDAVKSSFLLGSLESVPEVSARLREVNVQERKFEDVVKSAEQAAVLVLVY